MIKEMNYDVSAEKKELLAKFTMHPNYYDYEVVILKIRTHMCAYVHIPNEHPLAKLFTEKDDNYIEEDLSAYISCHGGVTYSSSYFSYEDGDSEGYWFGWDYAHAGDYSPVIVPGFPDWADARPYEHIWTIEEVIAECGYVVRQLEELEEEDVE